MEQAKNSNNSNNNSRELQQTQLQDHSIFQPSASHFEDSNISRFMKRYGISDYKELIKRANNDIAWYWDAVSDDLGIEWFQKYDKVYDSSPIDNSSSLSSLPWTKWFLEGKCNVVANAIDRHVKNQPHKVAYIFVSEKGTRKITYGELGLEVDRLASALKRAGVRKGDVVCIYMPMIPEAFFAIFACSKIGAVHASVFSGFSSQALRSRLADSKARFLITADSMKRRGHKIDLRSQWSKAIEGDTMIEKVITVVEDSTIHGRNSGSLYKEEVNKKSYKNEESDPRREVKRGGDEEEKSFFLHDEQKYNDLKTVASFSSSVQIISYADFVKESNSSSISTTAAETQVMDSEDPLFILYTSGTTGQPKGTIQVHGGFTIVAAQQAAYLIDLKPNDTLFWYADIGWITGQVWVVYGSAIVGACSLVYEETLDYPTPDAWCKLVQDYKVTILGVAPTAIRLFMKKGVSTSSYDLSSLRILACTGEPINKEAWEWYFDKVGNKRCPVINLSGGTEIGGAILSATPLTAMQPCTVGYPIPGFDADVFDEEGNPAKAGSEGLLVIKKPWPSMSRGLLNNPRRFIETYFSKYENVWYHGDIVLVDRDTGLWYMRGRADDVIKVSGHRIGTAEIEAAVSSHPAVQETVAIGRPDEIKGEAIVVICAVIKNYDSSSTDNNNKSDSDSTAITTISSSSIQDEKDKLKKEIGACVEESIGKFARPDEIRLVPELPKTRTGKLVRRLVRAKVIGKNLAGQDLSSVENPNSLDFI